VLLHSRPMMKPRYAELFHFSASLAIAPLRCARTTTSRADSRKSSRSNRLRKRNHWSTPSASAVRAVSLRLKALPCWGEASEHFGVALARKPSYGHGHHWHAHHLLATGKIEEALAASERSRALDPLDLIFNVHFAWHYWLVRRYDESIEEAKRTSELDAHEHWVPFFLGLAYGHKDMYGEAIIQHQTAVERSGGSSVMLAALGHTYATAGKRTEARRVLGQLKQLSTEKHVSSYEIAVIHVGLDETDEAFSWLEKAYEERSAWLPYSGMDPRLDPLRADARFTSLRNKVNVAAASGSR
jgi:tetratricopeptide (TPR) repeat protein